MPQTPYLYAATGQSRDVQRNAPTGARAAMHYPELGRTVELETDAHGRYVVTERPAPGVSGPVREVARGNLAQPAPELAADTIESDRAELTRLEAAFAEAGGRGVELAERIDALRAKLDGPEPA